MDAQTSSETAYQSHHRTHSMNDSTILQSLSPERTNRQPMLPPPTPTTVPSSPAPSVGSPNKAHLFQDPFLSSRRGSDVQGKVAQFNNLSRTNSERREDLEKALQRARLGREQAEGENEILKRKISEFVERERRVGLRLEESMEENERLQSDSRRLKEKYERAKDALTHSKERFREELRRMKGAEFKADSNQLAAQQALQSERQLIKSLEMELKHSRDRSDRFEKESFTTQIKLVEMDEQLIRVQQQMQLVEEERNALKTTLKEEEVARIAAEGRIPLPICSTPDEFSSPKKRRESHLPTPKGKRLSRPNLGEPLEYDIKKRDEDMASLARRLEIETLSRKSAEDLIHFMKLECQLKRCSCRLAESQGVDYVCDEHYYDVIADLKEQYEGLFPVAHQSSQAPAASNITQPQQSLIDLEEEIEFSPETGTFRTVKSPQKSAVETLLLPHRSGDMPSPNDTVIKASPPAFVLDSPSFLAPSEVTEVSRKISTDACQILPAVHINQSAEPLEEQHPATPKAYLPRVSDADLLSFTPFTLPALNSQSVADSTSHRAPLSAMDVKYHVPAPGISHQAESSFHSRPIPDEEAYSHHIPHQEAYVRPISQHSSTYPPPQHKTSATYEAPPQSRSASSHSQHHTKSSRSVDLRQTCTIQTITTTTRVPLAAEPATPTSKTLPQTIATSTSAPAGLGFSPGTTKSREEALACIRSWRKGNAEAAMASKDTNVKLNGQQTTISASGSGNTSTNPKPRSRSVVLPATPGRRKVAGDRDVSAPVRL